MGGLLQTRPRLSRATCVRRGAGAHRCLLSSFVYMIVINSIIVMFINYYHYYYHYYD